MPSAQNPPRETAAFVNAKLHETLTRRIEHLEQMEEKCELAESGLSDADLDAANG
jgi:N-methylhydantoinase A/oxoprolinase/acetone carboxylase beta subunit